MADILFVHNNFPGQFGQVAYALAQRGHRCMAIASETAGNVVGVPIAKTPLARSTAKGLHPMAVRAELDLIRARLTAGEALKLKDQGFDPRLIIGHPGWGETLLLGEVFPNARRLLHGEYYVPTEGGDIGFDPEMGPWTVEHRLWGRSANLTLAMAYLDADRIVCPTPYQASLLPTAVADRVAVIHEGIDTDRLAPAPGAEFALADGRRLGRETPLITFVARKLEPLRGIHVFLRALPQALAAVPDAQVLVIGAEGHGYGFRRPDAQGWTARYLAELEGRLDLSRMHFTGKLPPARLTSALQASSAHVYYSYPYALSWSMLEAMACGGLVVASDTAPVRDVIQPGVNGLLGDFFDVDGLAATLIAACTRPADFDPLRQAARRTVVEGYDLKRVCLPAWLRLVDDLL